MVLAIPRSELLTLSKLFFHGQFGRYQGRDIADAFWCIQCATQPTPAASADGGDSREAMSTAAFSTKTRKARGWGDAFVDKMLAMQTGVALDPM